MTLKRIVSSSSGKAILEKATPHSFEFDPVSKKWKSLLASENHFPIEKRKFTDFERMINNGKIHKFVIFLLGLPKTGKTTYIRQFLSTLDSSNSYSYFIPSIESSTELMHVINKRPTPRLKGSHNLIVLDDAPESTFNTIIPSDDLTVCLIPQYPFFKTIETYDVGSVYFSPLQHSEMYSLLSNEIGNSNLYLTEPILAKIIQYSGGIPLLAISLTRYFGDHGCLPSTKKPSKLLETFPILRSLSDSILAAKYTEIWLLILGVYCTNKSIKQFSRSVGFDLSGQQRMAEKLKLDWLMSSPLIRAVFFESIGKDIINNFYKEAVLDLPIKNRKTLPHIWTPDNDLRFTSSLVDYIITAMKNHSKRVEWDKILVNEKQVDWTEKIHSGDKIKIQLGRRIDETTSIAIKALISDDKLKHFVNTGERTKKYKVRRKTQRELVGLGDRLCDSKNNSDPEKSFLEAEKFYRKATNIKTDSNWANIRLANYYRLKGEINLSIDICNKVLRSTPNPYAALCLGICFLWQGNIESSYDYIQRAIKIKSSYQLKPKFPMKNNNQNEDLSQEKSTYRNAMTWEARCLLHLNEFHEVYNIYEGHNRQLNIQDRVIKWIVVNSKGYNNAASSINAKLIRLFDYSMINIRHAPLLSLFFFLNNDQTRFVRIIDDAKRACSVYKGLSYDIIMWTHTIDWESAHQSINKNSFLEQFQ